MREKNSGTEHRTINGESMDKRKTRKLLPEFFRTPSRATWLVGWGRETSPAESWEDGPLGSCVAEVSAPLVAPTKTRCLFCHPQECSRDEFVVFGSPTRPHLHHHLFYLQLDTAQSVSHLDF